LGGHGLARRSLRLISRQSDGTSRTGCTAMISAGVSASGYAQSMSEVRSAIEELRAEDLSTLPDARVEEDFAELQRAAELLEVERLRRLGEIDRRGVYGRDGH